MGLILNFHSNRITMFKAIFMAVKNEVKMIITYI